MDQRISVVLPLLIEKLQAHNKFYWKKIKRYREIKEQEEREEREKEECGHTYISSWPSWHYS